MCPIRYCKGCIFIFLYTYLVSWNVPTFYKVTIEKEDGNFLKEKGKRQTKTLENDFKVLPSSREKMQTC